MATVGSIQSLSGKFFAQDANGNIRELQVGDRITQGERVFGDASNVDTDKIEILSQDGGLLSFLGNQSHILDFSSVDSTFGNEEVAFKEESVWNAMDDESAIEVANAEETAAGDEAILEEETAAGEEGPTSSDSGVFSFNSRDGGSVDVSSGLRSDSFSSTDAGESGEEFVNSAPVVFNVDVTQNEVLDGYNIISGQLSVTDADANDTHTFFAVAGSLSVITPDGVEMNDVTFVFNPDGSYTISGDFNALAFGENAVVSFQYYAVDNVGNSSQIATLALTVVGTNDQPVVSDINANGEGGGEEFVGLDKLETTGTYEEGYLPSYRTWGQTFVAESDSLAKIDFNINDSYDNGIDSEVRVVIVSTDSFINDPATAWHPTTFGGNVVFEQNISLSFGSNNIVTVDTSNLNLVVGQQYQVILYHIGGDQFNIYYSASGNVDDGIALTEIGNVETGSGYIHGGYNMGITLTYGNGQTIVYESAGEIGTTDSDIYTTFEGNLATAQDDDTTDTHTYHLVNDTLAVNSSNIDPTLIEGLNVVVNEDGSYSITGDFNALATGETATVTFQYVADDGQGFDGTDGIHESSISEPATVTLTITGTNDQPVVSDINVNGTGNSEYATIDVLEGSQGGYNTQNTTIGQWFFTHNGGFISIDILTEFNSNVWNTNAVGANDINNSGLTEAFDSYIKVFRIESDGSYTLIASNDDSSGFSDGSVHHYDSYYSNNNLQAGNYMLAVGQLSFTDSEAIEGINYDSGYAGNGYTGYGPYIVTFTGDLLVTQSPISGSVVYETAGISDTQEDVYTTFEGNLATAQDDDTTDTHTYHLVNDTLEVNSSNIDPTLIEGLNVVVNEDGSYSITGDFNALATGETATVTFQYVADDGQGFDGTDGIHESSISEPATVTLTITGTNDQPVVSDINIGVMGNTETIGLDTTDWTNNQSSGHSSFGQSFIATESILSKIEIKLFEVANGSDSEYIVNITDSSGNLIYTTSGTMYDGQSGIVSFDSINAQLNVGEIYNVMFSTTSGTINVAFGHGDSTDEVGSIFSGYDMNHIDIGIIITYGSGEEVIYEELDGLNTFEGSLATAQDDDVNDTHTYSLVGIPTVNNDAVSSLSVVVNSDGTYTVIGDFNALSAGETATVTFQYVADDGRGFDGTDGIHESSISEPATVTLTITGTNDAPVAVDDIITVSEDVPFTSSISLLANDYDIDGDNITAIAGTFETLQGGTIVIAEDGSYTYTPPTNYSGSDSVEYTVTDGELSDTGMLFINVTPVSDAPNLVMSIGNQTEIYGNNLVVNGSFEDISGIDQNGNTVASDFDIPDGGLVYRIEIPGWKLDNANLAEPDVRVYTGDSYFVSTGGSLKPSTVNTELVVTANGYGINSPGNADTNSIDKNETLLFDLKDSVSSATFNLNGNTTKGQWIAYDENGERVGSGSLDSSITISDIGSFQYVAFDASTNLIHNLSKGGFYVQYIESSLDMPAMEPHHYNHAGVDSTDGDNYMDLGASPGNTSIYQTFETLEAGKTYKLTVDFRDKAAMQELGQSGRDSGVMQVLWNGVIVATILGDNVEAWNTLELDLVAQSGTNKLTFREIGESDDNWGMAIDNVQLVEVIGFSYDLNINATLTDESESLTPVTLLGSTLPSDASLFIGGELLEADDNGNYIIDVESGVPVVVNLQTSTELNLEEINNIEGSVTSQEVVDSVVVDEVTTTSTAFNEVDINLDGSATGTDGDDLFKIAGDDYTIDGGDGDDMLQLVSGYSIDFSGLSTFKNIEQIDLSATGSNALNNLSANDVLEMTDEGNEIVITGTSDDSVILSGNWSVSSGLEGFKSYTSTADGDVTVTLHIQDDIDVNTI